jgi:hypothetical protein
VIDGVDLKVGLDHTEGKLIAEAGERFVHLALREPPERGYFFGIAAVLLNKRRQHRQIGSHFFSARRCPLFT